MTLIKNSKNTKTNTIYNCNSCNDRGWILENNEARKCECFRKKLAKDLIARYGLEKRLQENKFSTYKARNEIRKKALMKAIQFANEFDGTQSIILQGQVGAGKTHLAMAIVGELIEKYTIIPFMYTEEIGRLKVDRNSFYEENQEHYRNKMDKFKNAPVLLIEDLFWGKKSEQELEVMYEILNYRYNNKKPMIITTELDNSKLLILNEALGSRLMEMCRGYMVSFGKDEELNARISIAYQD